MQRLTAAALLLQVLGQLLLQLALVPPACTAAAPACARIPCRGRLLPVLLAADCRLLLLL
jgi:hypothetical protein